MTQFSKHDMHVAKELSSLNERIENVHIVIDAGFKNIEKILSLHNEINKGYMGEYEKKLKKLDEELQLMKRLYNEIKSNQLKIITVAAVSGGIIAGFISILEKIHTFL